MRAERSRVRRLQRLETVRAHARQAAALAAAHAEGTLAQLEALAARTESMAAEYRQRHAPGTAQDLRQVGQFVAGLTGITRSTLSDAVQARIVADRKQQELAQAERSRAAAEDRARQGAKALASAREVPALGMRRPVGTGLE